MLNNNQDLKIKQLEQRAAKSYKIVEVYRSDLSSKNIFNFLKNQTSIPYETIEKITSSSKDHFQPIGSIMINLKSNNIVGFVGTFFSSRVFNNKKYFFCNIHSWIVNPIHRLYSFYLISDLVKKKVNLTAFTPIFPLKGLLEKLGFKKTKIKEKFFLNIFFLSFKNKFFNITNIELIKNSIEIRFRNRQNEIIIIKGSIVKKKKLKVFKIFSVSSTDLFKQNYKELLRLITKKYRIYFFSEYILDNNKAFIPLSNFLFFKKTRDIFIRSTINIDKNDLFSSDLAF